MLLVDYHLNLLLIYILVSYLRSKLDMPLIKDLRSWHLQLIKLWYITIDQKILSIQIVLHFDNQFLHLISMRKIFTISLVNIQTCFIQITSKISRLRKHPYLKTVCATKFKISSGTNFQIFSKNALYIVQEMFIKIILFIHIL